VPNEPNLQTQDAEVRPVTVTLSATPGEPPKVADTPAARNGGDKDRRTTTSPASGRFRREKEVPDRLPAHLKQRIREADWARHEATRHLDGALDKIAQLETRLAASSTVADEAAFSHAKAEFEKAKADLQAAIEAGDVTKQVEAQANLAKWAPEHARLDAAVARRKAAAAASANDPDRRRGGDDPDGRWTTVLNPKSQTWVKDNEDIMNDPSTRAVAVALNNRLIAEGLDPRTDEFFQALDQRLVDAGIKEDTGDPEEDPPADPAPAKPNGGTATPPTRGSMGNKPPAGGPVSVELSTEERQHARAMRMTDEAYALGKMRGAGQITADQHSKMLRELKQKGLA
jgi:hypothetical protein